MCKYCKSEHLIESTTTHVVDLKNHLIIIRNVPCMECDQCGEKFYSNSVAERLEEIVSVAKRLAQEISVIDYRQAA